MNADTNVKQPGPSCSRGSRHCAVVNTTPNDPIPTTPDNDAVPEPDFPTFAPGTRVRFRRVPDGWQLVGVIRAADTTGPDTSR